MPALRPRTIVGILGEVAPAGLLRTDVPTDVGGGAVESAQGFYRAAPGGVPKQEAFSEDRSFQRLDTATMETSADRGAVRDLDQLELRP